MTAATIDWASLRTDFPILDQEVHGHPLVYLDNAATSQKPRAVIDALVRYYERDNANVHRGIHELSNRATAGFEAARHRAARFINARSPEEIVFTHGTTDGINLVAQAWGSQELKKGDQILLTEMEHHSNIVPWQLVARRTGAELVYLPVTGDEGLLDLGELDRLLTDRVKLLSVVHISNSMGTVNPVAELCRRARKAGVLTLVDAAQSAGHCVVGRPGDGLRFSGLLRTQDLRADGGWGFVWPARVARQPAAVSRGRRDDSGSRIPADHFQARAPSIRSRDTGYFGADRVACGDGLPGCDRPGAHSGMTRNWRTLPTRSSSGCRRPVVRSEAGPGGAGELSVGGRACA